MTSRRSKGSEEKKEDVNLELRHDSRLVAYGLRLAPCISRLKNGARSRMGIERLRETIDCE